MRKPLRWVLRLFPVMLTFMLLAAVGLTLAGRLERTVEAQGQVTVHNYQIVRTPVVGQVVEVLAAGGRRVSAGQPLLRLDDPQRIGRLAEAEQKLAATRSGLARSRAELDLRARLLDPLEHSRRLEEQRQSRYEAELAISRKRESELDLEALERRLDQTLELAEHGLVSERDVEEARRRVSAAGERLRQRQIEEQQATANKAAVDIELRLLGGEQQKSTLDSAAELARLESEEVFWRGEVERLLGSEQHYLIAAEIDGVLVAEAANDLIGRQVAPGDELARVIDVESIRFISRIPEEAVIQVRTGQTAAVELVGLPKERFKSFEGKVRRIDQRPEVDTAGVPVYGVEILLDEPWIRLDGGDFYLRGGMRGKARIAYRHGMPFLNVVYEFLVGAPPVPQPTDSQEPVGVEPSDETLISGIPRDEMPAPHGGQS